jgi:hypothetical protein
MFFISFREPEKFSRRQLLNLMLFADRKAGTVDRPRRILNSQNTREAM